MHRRAEQAAVLGPVHDLDEAVGVLAVADGPVGAGQGLEAHRDARLPVGRDRLSMLPGLPDALLPTN